MRFGKYVITKLMADQLGGEGMGVLFGGSGFRKHCRAT